MGKTSIEWTARPGTQGESWNVVTGCTKVSEGCRHCYAETMHNRFAEYRASKPAVAATTVIADDHDGRGTRFRVRRFNEVFCHEDRLTQPLRWRGPRTAFVTSMGDLWHPDVPDSFIDQVQAVMQLCPEHLFVDVTKRPERRRDYLLAPGLYDRILRQADIIRARFPRKRLSGIGVSDPAKHPARWIWRLTSIEDQATADSRIPPTLETPSAVRGVSAEPLLGPVDFRPWLRRFETTREHGSTGKVTVKERPGIDWLIVGGESGPGARPFDVAWARFAVECCAATMGGCRCFVKQLGAVICDRTAEEWPNPHRLAAPRWSYPDGLVRRRTLSCKGGDPAEWPEDLRVREFQGR